MRKLIRRFLLLVVLLFVAIQFVPGNREEPAGATNLTVAADVRGILERSCFDCHSNETGWPWYSRVAPVSWFVADHVNEARSHLNFSDWDNLPAARKDHLLHEIREEVEEGEMPLRSYLALHPKSRLTDADRNVLDSWTGGNREGGERKGEVHH